MQRQAGGAGAKKPRAVAVFGESPNDVAAIATLVEALRSDLRAVPLRNPIVFIDRGSSRKGGSNVARMVEATKALNTRFDVRAIVVHKDTDDFEPAHVSLAKSLSEYFNDFGFVCVPAIAAWEIEAWWYLWPSAVGAVNPRWKALGRKGQRVGLIKDAKETLIRDLRPLSGKTRDYQESDSPGIAVKVKELNIAASFAARSDSFEAFQSALLKVAM